VTDLLAAIFVAFNY